MNYQWHYDQLVSTRKNRPIIKGQYYENHHIVMKSMGGKDVSDNLVMLTAREHFIAHWLLWRILRNRESAHAFFCMYNWRVKEKRIFSSIAYEEAIVAKRNIPISEETRKKLSDAGKNKSKESRNRISERHKGKKLSEEHKEKMSIARLNSSDEYKKKLSDAAKNITDEHREKISKSLKGREFTEDHKKNITKGQLGRKLSDETKAKISASSKNRIVSEETKLKMSIAAKNIHLRDKIS